MQLKSPNSIPVRTGEQLDPHESAYYHLVFYQWHALENTTKLDRVQRKLNSEGAAQFDDYDLKTSLREAEGAVHKGRMSGLPDEYIPEYSRHQALLIEKNDVGSLPTRAAFARAQLEAVKYVISLRRRSASSPEEAQQVAALIERYRQSVDHSEVAVAKEYDTINELEEGNGRDAQSYRDPTEFETQAIAQHKRVLMSATSVQQYVNKVSKLSVREYLTIASSEPTEDDIALFERILNEMRDDDMNEVALRYKYMLDGANAVVRLRTIADSSPYDRKVVEGHISRLRQSSNPQYRSIVTVWDEMQAAQAEGTDTDGGAKRLDTFN